MFPKLRFKKFNGDWEKTTIGAKSEIVTSGSRDWAQYYSDSGDKFIRMTNLVRNGINLDLSDLRFVQLPVGSNEGKRTSLEKGDILISITAELGKLGWIPEGLGTAYINQHTALVRMKNTLDSKFVAYALSTEKYNNKLNSLNDSGAKAGLNLGTIRSFELTIPSKPEQTQIASFLSVVDEKISQLTQKHQLLSQYKQGMMQKLFSQQIRFKADDGSEFGEWEETILSDIVNLFHGYQFRTSDFTSKGIAVIKIGNVIGNNLDLANLTYINENRLEDFKKFEILNGDILMSLTGNIGRIIEVKNKPFILLQNYRVGKFIPLNENFLIKPFLKYLLTSDLVFGRFSQLANQSAQANFGKQDMDKITVFYPSVSEQTKIANFLSAIDQKIEVVAQQIEQAKQWKKGLLQQMFV